MKHSFVTLLTDFGSKDHYVASMKGTILRINPQCTLIDITHHVSRHDIREGAFVLANAYPFFPKGTIHLSVVDPGVGSPRRAILVETNNYFFVDYHLIYLYFRLFFCIYLSCIFRLCS